MKTHICLGIREFETGQAHDVNSSYSFNHVSMLIDGLQHHIVIAHSPLQCAIWNERNLQEQL
jgi:hypothetical protein